MIDCKRMASIYTLATIKRLCTPLFRKAGVRRVSVFGSYATGKARAKSDVDFLFQPPSKFGLFELSALSDALSEKLGVAVDLVTERSLHPLLKKRIQEEAKRIV